jgi:hypothetical protein
MLKKLALKRIGNLEEEYKKVRNANAIANLYSFGFEGLPRNSLSRRRFYFTWSKLNRKEVRLMKKLEFWRNFA